MHFRDSKQLTSAPSAAAERRAFTLIELLVVIAIIGLLVGLLFPVLYRASRQAKINKAKVEMGNLVLAINSYDATYSRFPASSAAAAAVNPASPDFTFGTATNSTGTALVSPGKQSAPLPAIYNRKESAYQAANSDVMAILLDIASFPGTSIPTSNPNHTKNAQSVRFLDPIMTGDTVSPGVGSDLIYRDPWGNPYIITLDLNYDGNCRDAFYSQSSVSAPGLGGLIRNDPSNPDSYEASVPVMVWSLGPDGQADPTMPANQGSNKDNPKSWQ